VFVYLHFKHRYWSE